MDFEVTKLLSIMNDLGVRKIRLVDNRGWFAGNIEIVNGELKYDTEYANCKYKSTIDAFYAAYETLCEYSNEIKEYKSNIDKVLESGLKYNDYDDPSKSHIEKVSATDCYTSNDAKESGVTITTDGNIRGTIDQLRKFKSLTNNHYRYCRCAYSYLNDEVNTMLNLATKFYLFKPYSSFDEYYTGSVVD